MSAVAHEKHHSRPRVASISFTKQIRCGQAVENSSIENKGPWGLDVDMVARVVIVTRIDSARDVLYTTIVPFEDGLRIHYDPEGKT